MFIDSHCHIGPRNFGEETPEIVQRAREAGLSHLIHIGAGGGLDDCHEAITLVDTYPEVYCTLGVHPHDVGEGFDATEVIEEIRRLAVHPKVVAGETGLDFYHDHAPREAQCRAGAVLRVGARAEPTHRLSCAGRLRAFLSHRDEVGLPQAGGVLHCFMGTVAGRGLRSGFYVSLSGIVTFKR